MKRIWIIVIAFFGIGVGLYPIMYFVNDMSFLTLKPDELRYGTLWPVAFYSHIIFGGLSLLTGWVQFSKSFRLKNVERHRKIGTIYLLAVTISGICGLYLAQFAEGGLAGRLGFTGLAIAWLTTALMAYLTIRNKQIIRHGDWMIRNYAVTFAAVTLRLWLPFFAVFFDMNFQQAFPIIAWLCWVPNLVFAEWLVSRRHTALKTAPV